ncbi:ABC transporter permease [Phreatobacter sp. AB_2022a]|uniref:ABC transporter permease n=1 Tax=Phreatobacter sp. AB_2022a TaxID=3003134 RepID=UPI0022873FDA|nr:iron ABC transporter permease [Phreatobacter sp. AB_2022a]MCZ0738306.1 iron ABC transporter permease [Phreatobacter sp. AB_2022a]
MTDSLFDAAPGAARPDSWRPAPLAGRGFLVALAIGLAGLVALPILAVGTSLLRPPGTAIGHLAETVLPEILLNSLGLMAFVGLGTAVIGVGTAWLVTLCRFPGSRALEWLLLTPLAIPAYIIGYAYTDALAFAGPVQSSLRTLTGWSHGDYWFPNVQSLWGVSTMLTLVLYPYVFLLARAAFLDQSVCVLEAARTLGTGPWGAFFRVGLPMARPAIAAGVALALMEALADFGTVEYFGVTTFTTAIYRTWFGMGDRVAASQLATALLVFVLALVAIEHGARRGRRFGGGVRRHRRLVPLQLKPLAAAGAILACALPVLAGFAIPVAALIRLHADGGDPLLGARFLTYARNSFVLAGAAAVLTAGVGGLVAYAARLAPGLASTTAIRIASIGYAVPGTVIAVGILVPLGAFDNALDGWARATFGAGTGLVLSGTAVALLYAYLVRFLAVAVGPVEAGLHKIPATFDAAARTLGETPYGVAFRVHAPLLRRSLLTAALVVFVDTLKELPATLIIRPFDFDTLAVRVYNLASDERLAQASTGALVIVAIGLVPVILMTRMIAWERAAGERSAS